MQGNSKEHATEQVPKSLTIDLRIKPDESKIRH